MPVPVAPAQTQAAENFPSHQASRSLLQMLSIPLVRILAPVLVLLSLLGAAGLITFSSHLLQWRKEAPAPMCKGPSPPLWEQLQAVPHYSWLQGAPPSTSLSAQLATETQRNAKVYLSHLVRTEAYGSPSSDARGAGSQDSWLCLCDFLPGSSCLGAHTDSCPKISPSGREPDRVPIGD
ncbi:hypothetical protein P7K49_010447 [Saguinus oedipus]|uniref:Uncharacterized protein n=1 Tax=Saguinus oedipus TaxID=9490 RepID=A0ABQ9VMT3_SAGOE|nr:hypothetical protein P7K49_010447 [Saguinus oedipus]